MPCGSCCSCCSIGAIHGPGLLGLVDSMFLAGCCLGEIRVYFTFQRRSPTPSVSSGPCRPCLVPVVESRPCRGVSSGRMPRGPCPFWSDRSPWRVCGLTSRSAGSGHTASTTSSRRSSARRLRPSRGPKLKRLRRSTAPGASGGRRRQAPPPRSTLRYANACLRPRQRSVACARRTAASP